MVPGSFLDRMGLISAAPGFGRKIPLLPPLPAPYNAGAQMKVRVKSPSKPEKSESDQNCSKTIQDGRDNMRTVFFEDFGSLSPHFTPGDLGFYYRMAIWEGFEWRFSRNLDVSGRSDQIRSGTSQEAWGTLRSVFLRIFGPILSKSAVIYEIPD